MMAIVKAVKTRTRASYLVKIPARLNYMDLEQNLGPYYVGRCDLNPKKKRKHLREILLWMSADSEVDEGVEEQKRFERVRRVVDKTARNAFRNTGLQSKGSFL